MDSGRGVSGPGAGGVMGGEDVAAGVADELGFDEPPGRFGPNVQLLHDYDTRQGRHLLYRRRRRRRVVTSSPANSGTTVPGPGTSVN